MSVSMPVQGRLTGLVYAGAVEEEEADHHQVIVQHCLGDTIKHTTKTQRNVVTIVRCRETTS